MFDEAAHALVPPRRAGARSRAPARRAGGGPLQTHTRDRARGCSMSCVLLSRARPRRRRPRRSAMARPGLCRGDPDCATASERRTCRAPGNPSEDTGSRESLRALPRLRRRGVYRQLSVGPLSLSATHNLLEQRLGLDLSRAEASVACKRQQPVTRSSRSSSDGSWFARTRGPRPVRRCEYRRACASDFTDPDEREDRKIADAKKDKALMSAGIPIVRWQAAALPDEESIKSVLAPDNRLVRTPGTAHHVS